MVKNWQGSHDGRNGRVTQASWAVAEVLCLFPLMLLLVYLHTTFGFETIVIRDRQRNNT